MDYFETKYSGYKFDGVIATDDNAANFLESLGAIIDRSTPVVAVGINDLDTDMVVDLFERECGYQFDPQLTRLLLKHLPEFVAIRDTYPDTAVLNIASR